MAYTTTTPEQEYKRLRSYLNPYINGPNTTAVLTALATGSSSYLINNVTAVNESLYIVTAQGTYLDQRLAEYGIVRPAEVGLSDQSFREIGIQVKTRKQVRDLINKLLDVIFGDDFTKASDIATAYEPYNLADGDTLIVNFDEANTTTIVFHTSQFANIAAATAQEVADAITEFMSKLGLTGFATAENDGNGNYVKLRSNTIGPASSVTVMGGSAQNKFLFAAPVAAGGNMSTKWTISPQNGGIIRYTWSGGANPNLGLVEANDYVNIFGGGFASSTNEGTYTITSAVGGKYYDPINPETSAHTPILLDASHFEVENPLGTSGIVTQGTDEAMLFYSPVRKMLNSQPSYAAVYQTQANMLQVFLPATSQIIRRSRIGSAHIHFDPQGSFILNENPVSGDHFSITTATTLVAGTDFAIGSSTTITAQNLATAIQNTIPGLVANINYSATPEGNILNNDIPNAVFIQQNDASLTLTITYSGSQNITTTGPEGSVLSLAPNQPGPNSWDLAQPFVVSATNTVLTQELDNSKPKIFTVKSSEGFPNEQGYIVLGYGTELQEGPIPYIAIPSSDTILLSPAYNVLYAHPAGTSVFLVAQKAPVSLSQDGLSYPFYITDVASGRIYAQDLIEEVAAAGISIVFTIEYPGDIGLGKFGTIYSEKVWVWGP